MPNIVDLNTFANGALAERFNQELQKVMNNVVDPNTDPNKVRKVTMTVSISSDDNRELSDVSVQVKSTLVPAKNIQTKIIMDYDGQGKVTGAELKSGAKGQTFIDQEGGVSDDKGNKIIDLRQQQSK
ncbi:replication terminator protein [Neobacillus sp. OS1-2]|uniref:replication terminator protein n=1 Tax=Neobacillus sp. OS1-2 TaxID=3070680 RepID=UPI0027E01646|nr:replication terminator protein [Neobacillus sp. OS1-2]WML38678.1 replication terminator protein [Neobacillus sp. OS1-2]